MKGTGARALAVVRHRKRQVPSEFCLASPNLAEANRFSLGTLHVEVLMSLKTPTTSRLQDPATSQSTTDQMGMCKNR